MLFVLLRNIPLLFALSSDQITLREATLSSNYMSYFAYACKTEGKNGISRLISKLLCTLDSSLRDRLSDVTEWRTVAYPGDFRPPNHADLLVLCIIMSK